LARHFLQKGHRVFILDFNKDELEYTANVHLGKYVESQNLSWALCDLRKVDEIRQAAKKAAEFFDNRIDVLINNGGISSPFWKDNKAMDDFETAVEWQAYLETNLSAPFLLSQAVLPYMKTSKDRDTRKQLRQGSSPCIIHVSSFRMLQSDPNQEGYASSKSGMMGLTHSMAVSLSEFGIRVNLIAPGRIRVAHESRKGDEEGLQWKIEGDDAEKFAANRGGMPEDIAETAEFLVGAGFITGQCITVDGGATMQKR
jgi:NAD(P)-dependent dehydrogenase (short-subunit alcohol dehydrogenase family)